MQLITKVDLPAYPFRIDHQSPILMMGSCFTENIGQLLAKYLFPVCVNPFGVIYNPLSVKKGIEALIQKDNYAPEDLDQHNDLWLSFDHDTGYSSIEEDKALEKINRDFREAKEVLKRAGTLFITWGTAWIYRYKETGKVVCNCHKIPASRFSRVRLTIPEIIREYEGLLPQLFEFNPKLRIIHTVSPVRHWKDGAHGNQLSKATLLLAGEALGRKYPEQFFYFPSYEIVMDELRDYRYYTDDLLHTSKQASSYIWERFDQALLHEDSRIIMVELESLLKMLGHRPLVPEGKAYAKMVESRNEKLTALKKRYPGLQWDKLFNK